MEVKITDNSDLVLEEFQSACLRSLERCGLKAEGYAKDLCPVDTGNLKNSISHKVIDGDPSVVIGTNSQYGAYVELGTGMYVSGGRPTPWAYKDIYGNWHWTHGNPAKPYLKPAVSDHAQTYRNIIEDEMKNR